MEDFLDIRNCLAAEGYEVTPAQLEKIINSLRTCQRSLRDSPDTLMNLTTSDKEELIRQLAENGRDLDPEELEYLIEFAMTIRGMDEF